jgi:transposase
VRLVKRIRDRVAGLDVHRDTVVACVRLVDGDGGVESERRSFSTTKAGLLELAQWLADAEVTTVGMEATGIYWRPVFYVLEDRFPEVWLCNAHHVKNVPGRKTDLADAEWLADVVAHGMVRPSFVPPLEIREVRELTRYRRSQIKARGAEIQRLERLLQDAGIKLTSVASQVWSQSSLTMLNALIAGERDPAVLADMAKSRMRAKIPALVEALDGRFGTHHAVVAQQILDHIAFLDASIETLSAEIIERLSPFDGAVALADGVPGIDRRVAEIAVAETGVNMAAFPTAKHFASWLGLAPQNHESAGKRQRVGAGNGNPYLREALIEAARAAARTNTYLGAQYRHIARRRGANRAAIAVAHSIAVILWHIWTTGEPYHDLGADWFTRRVDPEIEAQRLARRIRDLGYEIDIHAA